MAVWVAGAGTRASRRIIVVAAVVIGLSAGVVAVGWMDGQAATDPRPPTPVLAGATEDRTDEPTPAATVPLTAAQEQRLAKDVGQAAASAERHRAAEVARRAAEERRLAEEQRRREEEARRREHARVTAFQERLKALGFLVGPADGAQGQQTTAAVMALQAAAGLQVDGVVGPNTEAVLADPPGVGLRGGPATRLEIDLDRQLLHLVEGGQRVVTMKASSGNGERYDRPDGSQGIALTPVGTFRILRRIQGVHESTSGLGTMYDPMYFWGGFAVHGSGNVPAGPASHGCVRLSRADATWLFDRVPDGTAVVVYGGQHTFSP